MRVSLAQRCVHHHEREAVARCPECARFFCRECISEHDDRVLCASCLARRGPGASLTRSRFRRIIPCLGAVVGISLGWWFFDLVGRGLMLLPPSVHEGTVWEELDEE